MFWMLIDDVFHITGRGIAVTGRIAKGSVSVGDTVFLIDISGYIISETITIKALDIGFSRVRLQSADEGINVGLIIGKVDVDIKVGCILSSLKYSFS